MQQIQRLWLVSILLGVVTACGGSQPADNAADRLRRGDEYLADNKLREATIEYSKAVQADPTSGVAHGKLADALYRAGDVGRALKEFIDAADRMPDDVTAQLRAGAVLLTVGMFGDAQGRADKVLAKDPANIDALILKGNALGGLKDFTGALTAVQQAIQADPTRSSGYSHLGALQLAKGDQREAEASFKQAISVDPKSAMARLALANLYWSSNRRAEAEVAIKEALKLAPNDLMANHALATLYLGTNRLAEAEAPLKVIAEQAKGPEGKLALADYYANTHRTVEAKALYEQMAAGTDAATTAKLRLAALGLMSGDRAGANRIIDEILVKDPTRTDALVARAQLQFSDGKLADALATARRAVSGDSPTPLAFYLLGKILGAQQQTEDAEAAYKDSLRLAPGFAPANVELARLAFAAGRHSDAVGYAQAAIDAVPGYTEAYLLLARAQIAKGNPAAAEAPLRLMLANFPNSPVIQAELGRLLAARSDVGGATAAFTKALASDPTQIAALEGMVVLDVQQKRLPAARTRLDAAVAAAPKNSELQLMAARLYVTAFNDADAAQATVRRAIAADPNNLAAYDFLARLYVQANDLPAATAEFTKLADRQPKSVANHTAVGLLNQLQNKPEEAKASYTRALALDPHAPVAANNLAQLYVDRNENLDVALQLAQTAKAGLPDSHEVDDTLGWIYYRKGNSEMSVSSLRLAVAAQPQNAVYLYHLGAAYALNKDTVSARQALDKALKIQPNFPGADDARKILDSLK